MVYHWFYHCFFFYFYLVLGVPHHAHAVEDTVHRRIRRKGRRSGPAGRSCFLTRVPAEVAAQLAAWLKGMELVEKLVQCQRLVHLVAFKVDHGSFEDGALFPFFGSFVGSRRRRSRRADRVVGTPILDRVVLSIRHERGDAFTAQGPVDIVSAGASLRQPGSCRPPSRAPSSPLSILHRIVDTELSTSLLLRRQDVHGAGGGGDRWLVIDLFCFLMTKKHINQGRAKLELVFKGFG